MSFVIEDRPAAVDDDGGGVNEWRLVGRQENGGPAHFLRTPDALRRMQFVSALPLPFRVWKVFQYSIAIGVSI